MITRTWYRIQLSGLEERQRLNKAIAESSRLRGETEKANKLQEEIEKTDEEIVRLARIVYNIH